MKIFFNICIVWLMILMVHGKKKSPDEMNILCWTAVELKDYDNNQIVAKTWSNLCNGFKSIQVKSKDNTDAYADYLKSTESEIYTAAFDRYSYKEDEMDTYDWIMVVHGGTFVLMNNIRQQLSKFDANVPRVVSCSKKFDDSFWGNLECGLLVSRGAYDIFFTSILDLDHDSFNYNTSMEFLSSRGVELENYQNWTDFLIDVNPVDFPILLSNEVKEMCPQTNFFLHYLPAHSMSKLQWVIDDVKMKKRIDSKVDALEAKIFEEIGKRRKEAN